MNLYFNTKLAENYRSNAQKVRVMTEAWLAQNAYCPACGTAPIHPFDNNQPVADFYCQTCQEQFELKSKNGKTLGNSIADGAYQTMLERIQSHTNPSFFFLSYDKVNFSVQNLTIVPKHFFTPDIIVPRQKGIPNRPNYIMCAINTAALPKSGKIALVESGKIIAQEKVLSQWQQFLSLQTLQSSSKGWVFDIMNCVDAMPNNEFTLQQMYAFEAQFTQKYPNNAHIKDKIRQQLQFLRDKGMIEFIGRGRYRRIEN